MRRRSRWAAGPTTFGPAGRLIATTLVILLLVWFAWWAPFVCPVFALFLMPLLLRDIWKPAFVARPKDDPVQPPIPDAIRAPRITEFGERQGPTRW